MAFLIIFRESILIFNDMFDKVTRLYLHIAFSIDNIIGKNKVIDANFTSFVPGKLFTSSNIIFHKIEELRNLNQDTKNEFPFFKKSFIDKQIDALELQLQIFNDPLNFENKYLESLKIFLDIEIPNPSIEKIKTLQDKINSILTNNNFKGTLHDKISTWRNVNSCSLKSYINEIEKYSELYKSISLERLFIKVFQSDVLAYISNNDVVNYKTVSNDEGWSAYNYYEGNYSGTIVFNENASFHKNNIKTFISHEGYPGHHMSGLIKEYFVKQILFDGYLGLQMLNVPSCLIEEGIADTGIELLGINFTSDNESLEYLIDDLNANVNYLVSFELFVKKSNDSTAIKILREEKFLSDTESIRSLKFIKSWKYYVPTYKLGRDFLRSLYSDINDKNELIKLAYLCPNPSVIKKYYEENN